MINKTVLKQMGFEKSGDPAWGHEVWYHESDCYVHYGDPEVAWERRNSYGSNSVKFNGDTDSMEMFFTEFIENVKTGAYNSATPYEED